MSKAEQKRMINSFYSRLVVDVARAIREETNGRWGQRCIYDDLATYEREVKEEERSHRRCWDERSYGISAPLSVKLFVVQRILEYRTGERKKPSDTMILWCQTSCLYAWAIWKEYGPAIRATFTMKESKTFLENVDYAELVATD